MILVRHLFSPGEIFLRILYVYFREACYETYVCFQCIFVIWASLACFCGAHLPFFDASLALISICHLLLRSVIYCLAVLQYCLCIFILLFYGTEYC